MKNGSSLAKSASILALSVLGLSAFPANANAQTDEADVQGGGAWSLAVTPRLQAMFHPAHSYSGLTTMPTFGVTATMTSPDAKWGLTGSAFYGQSEMTYFNQQSIGPASDLDFEAERIEVSGFLEYTAPESNVTFMVGGRYLALDFHEENAGATFVSDYDLTGASLEVGVRIAGQVAVDSPHSFSSQVVIGVGTSEFQDVTTGETPYSSDSLMSTAELALGYNYRMNENFYVGLRLRAMTAWRWDQESAITFGENDVAAFGPEFNMTIRF